MLSDLTPKQRALAEMMSDLSEEAYCAGWMSGLEYALWGALLGRRAEYGRLPFSPEEVARLRQLAQDCGGWIVFDDATQETWLPTAEWERRFAEWEKNR
jgi:hypothetical protein